MTNSKTARGLWVFSIIVVGILLLAGCQAMMGNVVTKEFDMSDFSQVQVSDAFAVQIRQGDEYRVTVEIDEGTLSYLEVDTQGDTLSIGLRPRIGFFLWNFGSVQRAEITMPSLAGVMAHDASRVDLSGFSSEDAARFEVGDASSLNGEIDTGDTTFVVSDASRVNLEGNRGDVEIEIGDASNITLVGAGQNVTVQASDASRVDLSDFTAEDASVVANDASNIKVNVSGTLDAEANDASSITYSGNPTMGDISSRDGSSINARN